MPAAPPGVLFIMTLPDPANPSQTLVTIEVDYNSSTGALTGASGTNNGTKPVAVSVFDANGAVLRTLTLAVGTNTVNARQLAHAGFSTAADCVGITFSLG